VTVVFSCHLRCPKMARAKSAYLALKVLSVAVAQLCLSPKRGGGSTGHRT